MSVAFQNTSLRSCRRLRHAPVASLSTSGNGRCPVQRKSRSANDLHRRHKSLVLMFKNVTVVDITAELLLGIEIYDDEDRRMGVHWNGVVPQVTTRIGRHGARLDFKRGR